MASELGKMVSERGALKLFSVSGDSCFLKVTASHVRLAPDMRVFCEMMPAVPLMFALTVVLQ